MTPAESKSASQLHFRPRKGFAKPTAPLVEPVAAVLENHAHALKWFGVFRRDGVSTTSIEIDVGHRKSSRAQEANDLFRQLASELYEHGHKAQATVTKRPLRVRHTPGKHQYQQGSGDIVCLVISNPFPRAASADPQ